MGTCLNMCRGSARSSVNSPRVIEYSKISAPIPVVGKWLQQVVTGYYNYHAVPGNLTSLSLFRARHSRIWRHQLRQRGDQRKIAWTHLPPLSTPTTDSSSPSVSTLQRHSSKVGAVCVKYARTVLCGGRLVRVVPTATRFSAPSARERACCTISTSTFRVSTGLTYLPQECYASTAHAIRGPQADLKTKPIDCRHGCFR
jgi:hypothetical protein